MTTEQPLSGDPIGRLVVPDERDAQYPIQASISDEHAQTAVNRGYRYWWQDGWWGDQWYTPQCVAYSWTHWLEDGPTTHAPRAPQREAVVTAQGEAIVNPQQLYVEAQTVDQWPGEDYDGTSVRAGAKILQRRGLISEYRWARSVEDVIDALLMEGPLVVGTWWYDSMFTPEPETGLIRVEGDAAGGHAYLLNGVNVKRETFRLKNSWGREWGEGGCASITFDDFDRLLGEQGEACLAIEVG